jgi:hypothetical protein
VRIENPGERKRRRNRGIHRPACSEGLIRDPGDSGPLRDGARRAPGPRQRWRDGPPGPRRTRLAWAALDEFGVHELIERFKSLVGIFVLDCGKGLQESAGSS